MEDPPSMFVLMGNFGSPASTSHGLDIAAARSNFFALATCLAGFTRLLVGGPGPCHNVAAVQAAARVFCMLLDNPWVSPS